MTEDELRRLAEALARLEAVVHAHGQRIEELVTRWEFGPVRMLAYGMAGLLLTGIILALLRLVVR